jgi:hypothetical protein
LERNDVANLNQTKLGEETGLLKRSATGLARYYVVLEDSELEDSELDWEYQFPADDFLEFELRTHRSSDDPKPGSGGKPKLELA